MRLLFGLSSAEPSLLRLCLFLPWPCAWPSRGDVRPALVRVVDEHLLPAMSLAKDKGVPSTSPLDLAPVGSPPRSLLVVLLPVAGLNRPGSAAAPSFCGLVARNALAPSKISYRKVGPGPAENKSSSRVYSNIYMCLITIYMELYLSSPLSSPFSSLSLSRALSCAQVPFWRACGSCPQAWRATLRRTLSVSRGPSRPLFSRPRRPLAPPAKPLPPLRRRDAPASCRLPPRGRDAPS